MSSQTRVPHLTMAALVPPTLMIATGHPVVGATTLGVVLLAWVAYARILAGAEQLRLGIGPDAGPQPALAGAPAEDWSDLELFSPDDDDARPWVHLHASEW